LIVAAQPYAYLLGDGVADGVGMAKPLALYDLDRPGD
jgi:hypothetical protein